MSNLTGSQNYRSWGWGSVVQSAKKAPPSAGCFFVPGQFQERNYARINRVRLGASSKLGLMEMGDGGSIDLTST